MARVARLAGLLLGLVMVFSARTSLADDDTERAEQSFSEGNRAFAAGDYHAAFDAYRAAWSLKQTFDIACNLGRTEVELSLSRDAAEHLDYCLRTFSVSSRDEVRDANKRFRELFERVRREVGALTLDVRPSGAEITVDGASYGSAPLGRDIFLTPGQHLVRAQLAGFAAEERSITAEAGGSIGVTFILTALPRAGAAAPLAAASVTLHSPAPPGPAPLEPAPARGMEPRTIVLISGAAMSLVALGIGVGFSIDADSARDDASRLGAAAHLSGAGTCYSTTTTPACVALHDAVDHQNRSRDAADIALATGGLIGAATLGAWLLIPDITRSTAGSVAASPWVATRGCGIMLSGTY
jgi:PEGA domain